MGFDKEFHSEGLKRKDRRIEGRTKPNDQPVRRTVVKTLAQYDLVSGLLASPSWYRRVA